MIFCPHKSNTYPHVHTNRQVCGTCIKMYAGIKTHTQNQKHTHTHTQLFSCVPHSFSETVVWTAKSCNALQSNNCHFCSGCEWINNLVHAGPWRFCKGIDIPREKERGKFFFLSVETIFLHLHFSSEPINPAVTHYVSRWPVSTHLASHRSWRLYSSNDIFLSIKDVIILTHFQIYLSLLTHRKMCLYVDVAAILISSVFFFYICICKC